MFMKRLFNQAGIAHTVSPRSIPPWHAVANHVTSGLPERMSTTCFVLDVLTGGHYSEPIYDTTCKLGWRILLSVAVFTGVLRDD